MDPYGYGGGMGMGGGMGGGMSRGQDPTMMIVICVCFACALSVMLGGVGWTQGWFGNMYSAPTTPPYTAPATTDTTDTTATDTSSDAGYYQGLTTACALSYKPAKDSYNSAVPPFNANECQGAEFEANCAYWQSVQESANNWTWQRSGSVDGCVPVPPGSMAVGTALGGGTTSGGGMGTESPSPGTAQAAAGGLGKTGRWKPMRPGTAAKARAGGSKKTTRSSRARAGGTSAKRIINRVQRKTTRRRAGSPPAPFIQPAFSGPAPFTTGSIAYTMF